MEDTSGDDSRNPACCRCCGAWSASGELVKGEVKGLGVLHGPSSVMMLFPMPLASSMSSLLLPAPMRPSLPGAGKSQGMTKSLRFLRGASSCVDRCKIKMEGGERGGVFVFFVKRCSVYVLRKRA